MKLRPIERTALSSTTAGALCRNRKAAGQRPAIKPAAFDRRRSDDWTWGERSRQYDLNSIFDSADSPMGRNNDAAMPRSMGIIGEATASAARSGDDPGARGSHASNTSHRSTV